MSAAVCPTIAHWRADMQDWHNSAYTKDTSMNPAHLSPFYEEQAHKLPARTFDVVIAGGGTAGVVAAIAAARQCENNPG